MGTTQMLTDFDVGRPRAGGGLETEYEGAADYDY